jgi:hypothetical protein
LAKKLVTYTVTFEVDAENPDSGDIREGIEQALSLANREGFLTKPEDEETVILGWSVQHTGTVST